MSNKALSSFMLREDLIMLGWALTFLVLAIIAGALGSALRVARKTTTTLTMRTNGLRDFTQVGKELTIGTHPRSGSPRSCLINHYFAR